MIFSGTEETLEALGTDEKTHEGAKISRGASQEELYRLGKFMQIFEVCRQNIVEQTMNLMVHREALMGPDSGNGYK